MKFILLFLLTNFLVVRTIEEQFSDIITLHHGGRIQGLQRRSYKNNIYYSFQEIPYAVPPVGNLRFMETSDAKPWTGVIKTSVNTKVCVQLHKNDPKETEDCLYLNVYTPSNLSQNSTLLPVYFYIHGGFFTEHSGSFDEYGPHFLMDYEILLVTMNYRLGALGFLSTGDSILPGNLGFKDQNLALKWVQKNINLFGGDPQKVTIGGQSAGAGAIGYHILSERSKGLFRGAIIQSGSSICSKMFAKRPRYFAFQLGRCLEKNIDHVNTTQELKNVLLKASAEDIKKCSDLPIPESYRNAVGNEGSTVWNPVEEYEENSFIKGPMHENFKNGVFSRVPIFIGMTSEEEMHYDTDLLKTKSRYFDSNDSYLINGNLNIEEKNILPAGRILKKVYTNKTFEENFGAFVRFISDIKYTNGICRLAELASKYTDVYFYQFSYDGTLGGNDKIIPDAEKVGHAEELNYLFQNKFNREINRFPEKDLKVQKQLLKIWTSFIKYQVPIPEGVEYSSKFTWPKVTSQNLVYVNINDSLKIEYNPRNYQQVKAIYEKFAEEFQYTF